MKKLVALVLGVGMLAGASMVSACGNGGNNNGDIELTAGEQVTNEAEWKQAFDNVLKADNFTVKTMSTQYVSGMGTQLAKGPSYVDFKNSKIVVESTSSFEPDGGRNGNISMEMEDDEGGTSDGIPIITPSNVKTSGYYEVDNSDFWGCSNTNNQGWVAEKMAFEFEDEESAKDWLYFFVNAYTIFQTYFAADLESDFQCISEFYSRFTYQDGFYVADNFFFYGEKVQITVSISNGSVQGIKSVYTYDQEFHSTRTLTQIIENVNSTSVITPNGVRAAIEAKKEADKG